MTPRLAALVIATALTACAPAAAHADPPADPRPVLHAAELLRHHPGVRLVGTGSRMKIYLRGSLGEPLVVVDGLALLPDPAGTLGALNPRDIAHIRVLTDPADLSFYGSRAANGVILIATRR